VQLDADDARNRVARLFLKAHQPLGAAVLYAESARAGSIDPEIWCGLGASLMGARGVLVRQPFEDWAARVFRHAAPWFAGTAFSDVAAEWQPQLPPPSTDASLGPADLDELLAFLLVTDDVLASAIDALAADDRVFAIMMLLDASPHAVPITAAAIRGRWGLPAARAALKRAGAVAQDPAVRAALDDAARGSDRDQLEPYLGWVRDRR
jgi:hypothetical protein